MTTKTLIGLAFLLHVSTASAQRTTFGGIPLWADSALRAAGLDQRFTLTSTINPILAFGDFDRDGLVDIAIEIKATGGCGIAIAHRIDRSVHIVGAGQAVRNGASYVACGRWGAESARRRHRHAGFSHDLLYAADPTAHSGWIVWDGRSYAWVQAD
jgi:hypothetical protein